MSKQVINLLEFESALQLVTNQIIEAKESEIKIRSFFESSSSIHVLIDKNYRLVAFNKAAKEFVERIYGVIIAEGINIKPFVRQAYINDFIENCTLALNGDFIKYERFLKFNDSECWWSLAYEPARDASGEIIGISFHTFDITKRVEQEQKVIKQNEALKKIAFIQSHELRKPVASIMGFMNIFKSDGFTASREELIMMNTVIDELDVKIREIVAHTDQQ